MSRSNRAKLARQTVKIVEDCVYRLEDGREVDLREAIRECLMATELIRPGEFDDLVRAQPRQLNTRFDVRNETTLAAAKRLVIEEQLKNVLCLNFASAKNPGGGYLGGSQAQEESLARCSALVKALESKWEYYVVNRSCGTALYTDHMILSPRVPVFREDDGILLDQPYMLSVVTSPAVNAGAVTKNEPAKVDEIGKCMSSRIDKLLRLAAARGYQHLILGAWGCGVFRNDPEIIARIFAEALKNGGTYENVFDSVTFAILDGTNNETIIGPFQAHFR